MMYPSKCVYCGSELKSIIGVQKEYLKNNILIINNIPLVLCPKCMEEYIPAESMSILNEIILTYNSDSCEENSTIVVDYNDFIPKSLEL